MAKRRQGRGQSNEKKKYSRYSYLVTLFFVLFCYFFAQAEIITTKQGQTFTLYVNQAKQAQATFLGQKINFYPFLNSLRGIIGIMPETKTGTYSLEINTIGQDNITRIVTNEIEVEKGSFRTAYFSFKPAKRKILLSNIVDIEWAEIEKKLIQEFPEQIWRGKFILPTEGIISMPFGTHEFVNGKARSQHRGTDIANKSGTDIFSPNSGRVVVAKNYQAFGNTIVIDHGQGINTLYFHLSKILVSEGQEVKQGELIGKMGTTGISTAPHLHWGMSVHNIRVNPLQWTKEIF